MHTPKKTVTASEVITLAGITQDKVTKYLNWLNRKLDRLEEELDKRKPCLENLNSKLKTCTAGFKGLATAGVLHEHLEFVKSTHKFLGSTWQDLATLSAIQRFEGQPADSLTVTTTIKLQELVSAMEMDAEACRDANPLVAKDDMRKSLSKYLNAAIVLHESLKLNSQKIEELNPRLD
ncbi:hypothetical protein H0H92_011085 [Tricholoma furcatifolium]|nr:hypothetical protein H0H92_011085 [Tricholoma furcatifolium]